MYMQTDDEKKQWKLDYMREFWAEWVSDTPEESLYYLERCKRIAKRKRLLSEMSKRNEAHTSEIAKLKVEMSRRDVARAS
jgi:hypothetical protein